MKQGLQDYKVEETNDQWVLYHNNFSLCSRKVRMCLTECQLPYRSEHVDLIETGKYEVCSKDYLKINPGATVPVLLHEGRPIYESHEQIYYLSKNLDSHSQNLIPKDTTERDLMDYWVRKSSIIGDPLDNLDKFAGNCVAPLTTPLFATMIQYVSYSEILKGLFFHPIKKRVLIFFILKAFGLNIFKNSSPLTKLLLKAFASLRVHLQELEDHLSSNKSHWLVSDHFSLADVSWAVLFHRIEETGWMALLIEDKQNVQKYFNKIKLRPSYKEAILDYKHPIVDKGVKDLFESIKNENNINKIHTLLRATHG
jgi:glutathione S-transferase